MFVSSRHEQFASPLESIAGAFAVFQVTPGDGDVVLVSTNTLFEEVTARPIAESIGATLDQLLPGSVETPLRACIARRLAAQTPQDDELAVERDATTRWWRLVVTPILHPDTSTQRLMVTLIDISDKNGT